MKKTGLFVLLLATAAWAQSGTEASADPQGTAPSTVSFPTLRIQTPTYADLYCAGFISKQILPDANYVAGGLQTPPLRLSSPVAIWCISAAVTPRARSMRSCAL